MTNNWHFDGEQLPRQRSDTHTNCRTAATGRGILCMAHHSKLDTTAFIGVPASVQEFLFNYNDPASAVHYGSTGLISSSIQYPQKMQLLDHAQRFQYEYHQHMAACEMAAAEKAPVCCNLTSLILFSDSSPVCHSRSSAN